MVGSCHCFRRSCFSHFMAEKVLVPRNETTHHHVPEHCNHDMIMRILNVAYVFMCSFATLSEDCMCNCAASLKLLSGFF